MFSILTIPSASFISRDVQKFVRLRFQSRGQRAVKVFSSSSDNETTFEGGEKEIGKLHLDGGRSMSASKAEDPDMSDEAAISWPYSRVEEFMTKDPETLCESLKLTDLKVQSFIKRYHGGPVVDEDGNLVGVISRNDVKRLSYISFGEEQRHIRTVADAMTSMPLTVGPKAYISAAAGLMLKHKIHRLPVVEEGEDYAHPGKLIGIITRSDIWEPLIQNSLMLDKEFQKRRCDVYQDYSPSSGALDIRAPAIDKDIFRLVLARTAFALWPMFYPKPSSVRVSFRS